LTFCGAPFVDPKTATRSIRSSTRRGSGDSNRSMMGSS
jgi:hypothetical protein